MPSTFDTKPAASQLETERATPYQRPLASFLRQTAESLPAAALAAAMLGAVEFLMLPTRDELGFGRALDFLFVASGITTLALLPIGLAYSTFGALLPLLVGRLARPRLALAAAFGAVSLPYAYWLGRFTFSGPRVADLPYQPLLVFLATSLVSLGVAMTFLVFSAKPVRWTRLLWAGLLCLPAVVSWLLNQRVIPGQYEPLHTFLSLVTCTTTFLSLTHLLRRPASDPPRWSSPGRLMLLAAFLSSFPVAMLRLSSTMRVGALMTQSSTTPRYLYPVWAIPTHSDPGAVAELIAQIKPTVNAPRGLEERRARRERRPNLILFFVDNMSPSRTGFLGYQRKPTTPNLDRIAREGTIFTQAYSSIPHTRLFNTSLLTGRFSHRSAPDRMPQTFVDLAVTKLLHDIGYHVMAQNWFDLSRSKAFEPKRWGIDTYVRPPTPEEEAATDDWPVFSGESLLTQIERHLEDARRKNAPVFLWVHLINPHGIPRGPGQYRHDPQFAFGPTLDDRYDGAIASADRWFLPMQRLLEKHLVDPTNTYFVLGSDHGSGINRFRKKVSKTTWQDHVHVPLAIAGPTIPKRKVEVAVDSALDVAATLVDLAGLAPPREYDGISLIPLATGEWHPTQLRPIVVAVPPHWTGVIYGKKKLVKNKETLSLFDISVDPGEQHDIADEDPKLARRLSQVAKVVLARRMKARLPVRSQAVDVAEPE